MREPKMGGQRIWRVHVCESNDVIDSLLSKRDGGGKLDAGLQELVAEKYKGVEVRIVRGDLTTNDGSAPDIVVFSAQPAVQKSIPPEEFQLRMIERIYRVKRELNAHVLIYNCSSIDPKDNVSNYHGVPDTFAIRVQKLNLALIHTSKSEGISIIDVERIVGQLAGQKVVKEPLDYTDAVYIAMGTEFLRVMKDIGFFEDRPLVMQVGEGTAVR